MDTLPFPILPNQDLYMPGDKVEEILPCGLSGGVYRVKARFAIDDFDYITLQNVETRSEYTLDYWDIIGRLYLVCHPIKDAKFID